MRFASDQLPTVAAVSLQVIVAVDLSATLLVYATYQSGPMGLAMGQMVAAFPLPAIHHTCVLHPSQLVKHVKAMGKVAVQLALYATMLASVLQVSLLAVLVQLLLIAETVSAAIPLELVLSPLPQGSSVLHQMIAAQKRSAVPMEHVALLGSSTTLATPLLIVGTSSMVVPCSICHALQSRYVMFSLGKGSHVLYQGLDLQHSPSNAGAPRAIPLVECLQIFSAYTLSTFNTSVQVQLISVLVQSISALVGSEVTVTITSVRSGSVVVATSVLFLSGNSNDATTYVSTLTSSSFVSLYGSNFGAVAVDTGSVTITSASSGGSIGINDTSPGLPELPPVTSTQPPPPPPVPATPWTAQTVPAVTAKQTLSAYTVESFTHSIQQQFISTVEKNVESLSGSPVKVTIDSISAGSVNVATTTVFLNGNADSVAAYQMAVTGGSATSIIFGTAFGSVAVDASSVKVQSVSNSKSTSGARPVRTSIPIVLGLLLMVFMLGA
ncbi:hypothetical protein ABBQ38_001388 [Trebouxia sp. C0009 RCD-2024]